MRRQNYAKNENDFCYFQAAATAAIVSLPKAESRTNRRRTLFSHLSNGLAAAMTSHPLAPEDTTRALLRHRPFRLMFIIRFAAQTSNLMLSVVVGWHLYDITGSALHLGLIGLVQFAPTLALTLFAGQIADRQDRRHVLRMSFSIGLLVPLGFVLLAGVPEPPLFPFYGLLFLGALARTFESPSLQALLPSMVGRDVLARAIALSTSAQKMSVLLGPSLGGLLYMIGPEIAYGGALVLVVVAAWASFALPPPQFGEPRKGRDRSLGTVFEGLRFIWERPILLGVMSLDLLAVFFGGVNAILPIFAKDILDVGPVGLGILRSSPAVGALMMAVILARFPIRHAAGRVVLAGVAAYGVATLVFGLSENIFISVAAMLLVGAGDMLGQVLRQTIIQLRTPDDMRGRVASVSGLSVSIGGQLGQFESGVTAAWFGPVGSVLLGGVAVLVIVGVWAWKFPALRQLDKTDPDD